MATTSKNTSGKVEIKTGYTPRSLQQIFHNTLKRFNVLVCHRRFGKTVFAVNEIIDRAIRNPLPNPQYAYIAPTYKQAKQVAWQYFKDYTKNIPNCTPNKSELTVYIERPWRVNPKTGESEPDVVILRLIGADDPDSIRGIYLDGAVLDEYAQCDPILWGEIVRPALADRATLARELGVTGVIGYKEPWAIFIGTPKGQNHFFRRFNKAAASETFCKKYEGLYDIADCREDWGAFEEKYGILNGVPEKEIDKILSNLPESVVAAYEEWLKYLSCKNWMTALYKASETGILDRNEMKEMVEDLDEEEVEQELECSFTAAIKGSYFGALLNQAKSAGQVGRFPCNPNYEVETFWDIGMSDKTAIWFRQKIHGQYYYINYLEANGEGIDFYARCLDALAGRVGSVVEVRKGFCIMGQGYKFGRHIWPHDGKTREWLANGKTRQQVALRDYGLDVRILKRVSEADYIDAARRRIKNSFFDEKGCGRGLECLYNFQKEWDNKKMVFKNNYYHDWSSHGSVGFCYSSLDDSDSRRTIFGGSSAIIGESSMPRVANGNYNELGA